MAKQDRNKNNAGNSAATSKANEWAAQKAEEAWAAQRAEEERVERVENANYAPPSNSPWASTSSTSTVNNNQAAQDEAAAIRKAAQEEAAARKAREEEERRVRQEYIQATIQAQNNRALANQGQQSPAYGSGTTQGAQSGTPYKYTPPTINILKPSDILGLNPNDPYRFTAREDEEDKLSKQGLSNLPADNAVLPFVNTDINGSQYRSYNYKPLQTKKEDEPSEEVQVFSPANFPSNYTYTPPPQSDRYDDRDTRMNAGSNRSAPNTILNAPVQNAGASLEGLNNFLGKIFNQGTADWLKETSANSPSMVNKLPVIPQQNWGNTGSPANLASPANLGSPANMQGLMNAAAGQSGKGAPYRYQPPSTESLSPLQKTLVDAGLASANDWRLHSPLNSFLTGQTDGKSNLAQNSNKQTDPSDLPAESTVNPSGSRVYKPSYGQDGQVVKAPYKTGGYTKEELKAMGNNARSDKDYGYGRPVFEGYYLAPDGNYYPVNQNKAAYAISQGMTDPSQYWYYDGYSSDVDDFIRTFGVDELWRYTPDWKSSGLKYSNTTTTNNNSWSYNGNNAFGSGSSNTPYDNLTGQARYANPVINWSW